LIRLHAFFSIFTGWLPVFLLELRSRIKMKIGGRERVALSHLSNFPLKPKSTPI